MRPEGNRPGGVGSLGKPEEIGEVGVGNGEAWVNWQSGRWKLGRSLRKIGCLELEVGETPEVRPEGNGPGGVESLGKPEEIGEVVVGNGEAWGVRGGSWGDT